jgi:hypothetical protein
MADDRFHRVTVPPTSSWAEAGAQIQLTQAQAAALERAQGALVRSVYQFSSHHRQVTALGYHRRGTAQEKLTALSGSPTLFEQFADRVAAELSADGAISLKLELPADAPEWAQAATAAGFEPLAAPLSPAPLPHDPTTIPLGFIRRLGGWTALELAYFRQTTEFTCGPVAALTATAALGLTPALDRASELQFWREATSAPGCDGYGLAAALATRGVLADVSVNTTQALQVEAHPSAWQKELREFTQRDFRSKAEQQGVQFRLAELSVDDVFAQVRAGRLVLLLIDEELMHAEACPHWVVVHGVHDRVALIEDPWTDDELGESWVDAHQLAIPAEALAQMTGWDGYRSALVLTPATGVTQKN